MECCYLEADWPRFKPATFWIASENKSDEGNVSLRYFTLDVFRSFRSRTNLYVTYQEDDMQSAVHEFCVEILNKQCLLNVEYKNAGVDCVTLCHADSKDDVAQLLLTEGWLLVEARREKRLAKLVGQYQKAQEKAKEGRVSARFIFYLFIMKKSYKSTQ